MKEKSLYLLLLLITWCRPVLAQDLVLDQWQYQAGDDMAWRDANYPDMQWPVCHSSAADSIVNVARVTTGKQIAWFRTRFQLDSAAATRPLALSIRNNGAMEIYLDGELQGSYGEMGINGAFEAMDQSYPLLVAAGKGQHLLAIRYANDRYSGKGAFRRSGFSVELLQDRDRAYQIIGKIWLISLSLLPAASFFFLLFVIHLLFFLFYSKDRSNSYFALFNFGMGLWLFLLFAALNTDHVLFKARAFYVIITAVLASAVALSAAVNHLFGSFGWRFRLVLLLCAASLAGMYVLHDDNVFAIMVLGLFGLITLEAAVLITRAIFRKVPGAGIPGAGILFFLGSISTFIILVVSGGFYVSSDQKWGVVLLVACFVLTVISIPVSVSAYMAWKFAAANKDLQRQLDTIAELSVEKQAILEGQKERLEQEVAQRTAELTLEQQQLQAEKQKSDALLLNILPAEVAEELKTSGRSGASFFDQTTVLFTDFVNFTQVAELLSASELVAELHACFTAFDELTELYGLEKIKTIGDAYLAVCGVPVSRPDHAVATVRAALAIVDFIAQRRASGHTSFEVRVGIHSGPLVAGIVGVRKFAYDIWGDTVNTASRMESSSEPGKVNISEDTFLLVRDHFACVHRGKIAAKNKGELDMYFVTAKRNTKGQGDSTAAAY